MQLQGQTQELAIEEYLAKQFPLIPSKKLKKVRGADSLHVVNTRTAQNCGSMLVNLNQKLLVIHGFQN